MTKIVKGIGKAVKGILKGVKKVFKKVVKSDLFKVALLGTAIFMGGSALGMWGNAGAGTGAGAGTAAATGESAASTLLNTGTTAANTAATTTAGTTAATNAANAVNASNIAATTGQASGGIINNAIKSVGGAAGNVALPDIVVRTPTFLEKAGSVAGKVGGFVEKHPMASAMMFNAVSSALSPDEIELMEEQERIKRERWQNMQTPDSIGLSPSGQPLTDMRGRSIFPQGIIRRGMRV